jgi:hypothetical protein
MGFRDKRRRIYDIINILESIQEAAATRSFANSNKEEDALRESTIDQDYGEGIHPSVTARSRYDHRAHFLIQICGCL